MTLDSDASFFQLDGGKEKRTIPFHIVCPLALTDVVLITPISVRIASQTGTLAGVKEIDEPLRIDGNQVFVDSLGE